MKYTATYWDASLHDPERLAIDVLRDGRAAGADRAPRRELHRGGRRRGRQASCCATWRRARRSAFAASVVINASGPWTDLTNDALGDRTGYMGGTKGSHIVLDNPALLAATGGRELFFENADGRIVLIYPLKGRVLVGTTDLEHEMGEPTVCTEAEVDYFIDLIGQVLPDVAVDRAQIVYRFSGVRPLPRPRRRSRPASSRATTASSRRALPGTADTTVLSLVGGKWTTFRASAENLADHALELLAVPRRRSTKGLPIGGGRGYPMTERARRQWIDAHAGGLDPARVATLLDRYGTVAADVIAAIANDPQDAAAARRSRPTAPASCGTSRAPSRSCTWTTCSCAARASRFIGAVTAESARGDRAGDRAGDGVGCRAVRVRDRTRAREGARGRSDLDRRGVRGLIRVAIA